MGIVLDKEYLDKLNRKCDIHRYPRVDVIELATKIADYVDETPKVTRILNILLRHDICSVDTLLNDVDIEAIRRFRGVGMESYNIIRQICGLPVFTYDDFHPYSTKYEVTLEYLNEFDDCDACNWPEDTVVVHTLDELLSVFNKYNYNEKCCSQKARITNIRKLEGGPNDRN